MPASSRNNATRCTEPISSINAFETLEVSESPWRPHSFPRSAEVLGDSSGQKRSSSKSVHLFLIPARSFQQCYEIGHFPEPIRKSQRPYLACSPSPAVT